MRFLLIPLLCCLGATVDAQNSTSPLKRYVGTFDVSSKFYMRPGQPPMKSTATAVFREVMGGRFVRQEFKDKNMGVEGTGYMGYDPRTKKFSSVWMYSMSARMEYSEGAADEKGVLKLEGEGREFEHTWTDADTRLMKSWRVSKDGKRSLVYEITYKRRK